MEERTTNIRQGIIDKIDVEFTVTAEFNGINVCGAVGKFYSPKDAYQRFGGVNKILKDIITGNEYQIFVTDSRFSFGGYKDIDALF